MPDIIDMFPHLKSWETLQLQSRRNELIAKDKDLQTCAPDDPRGAERDTILRELVCISRILRVRGSIAKPKADPAMKRTVPSLDML